MAAKQTKTVERNGVSKSGSLDSVWVRAFSSHSEWPDKVNIVSAMIMIQVIIIVFQSFTLHVALTYTIIPNLFYGVLFCIE